MATPGTGNYIDQFDGYTLPYVNVSYGTSNLTLTLSNGTTQDIAYFKSHFRAKVLSNKAVTVGGWAGRLVIMSGVSNGGRKLFQHLLLVRGHVGYALDMEGNLISASNDTWLFRKIYVTFRSTLQ